MNCKNFRKKFTLLIMKLEGFKKSESSDVTNEVVEDEEYASQYENSV